MFKQVNHVDVNEWVDKLLAAWIGKNGAIETGGTKHERVRCKDGDA